MAKIVSVKKEKIVNFKTGKTVVEYESSTVNVGSEPEFIKIYLGSIMYLKDMPTNLAAIMMCILKQTPYSDSENVTVILTKDVKEDIAAELRLSYQTVVNAIVKLVKGKILFHQGSIRSARYLVNPYIFGKGHWKDVKKLQLHVDFEPNQTTFWTEVSCADVPKEMRIFKDMFFKEEQQKRKEQAEARRKKEYEELKAQIRKELEEEMKRAE